MSHLSEEKLDQLIAEERAREQPPLNDWRTIAARAREEGLIRESSARSWVLQPWVQADQVREAWHETTERNRVPGL